MLHIINESNERFPPVLCQAASFGDISIVQILLDANANTEVCWGYYGTPLSAACLAGHLDVVKYLIEKGAKTSWTESNGRPVTAMEKAKGHKHILHWLQKRERTPQNEATDLPGIHSMISNMEAVPQAKRRLPRLRAHEISHESIDQPSPTEHRYIRRRRSFVLEYLIRGTNFSFPQPLEAQSSTKDTTARHQPISLPICGVAVRQQYRPIYELAISRRTDILLPQHYEMYPLVEMIF